MNKVSGTYETITKELIFISLNSQESRERVGMKNCPKNNENFPIWGKT